MGTERGSVSVEFAVVLPVVVMVLLAVAQVGVTVGEVLTLTHAAREGARVYAVTADPARATAATLEAGNLDPARTTIVVTSRDGTGTVEVAARARVFPGLPGPEVPLRARAVMRMERRPP